MTKRGDLTRKQKAKLNGWLGLSILLTIITFPVSFLVLMPIDITVVFITGLDWNLTRRFNDRIIALHKKIMNAQFRIIFGNLENLKK